MRYWRKCFCAILGLVLITSTCYASEFGRNLKVEEEDGTPSSVPVYTIEVPNGTLVKDSTGVVSLNLNSYLTSESDPLSLHLATPNQTVLQVPTFNAGLQSNGSIGVGTTPDSNTGIFVNKTNTTVDGAVHGAIRNYNYYNPTASSPDFSISLANLSEKNGTYPMTGEYGGGGLVGQTNIARNNGTGTVTWAYGSIQSVQSVGGGVITNAYSLYIPAPYITGAGSSITNNTGLFIADQSYGTGTNYSIYSQGGANYFGGLIQTGGSLTAGGYAYLWGGSFITGGNDWTSLPAQGYGVYSGYANGHGYITSVAPGVAGSELDILGYPIKFMSAQTGAELMRVQTNGFIGIGTDAPQVPLHVKGNATDPFGKVRLEAVAGTTGAETYELRQGIPGVSNGGFSIADITGSAYPLVIQATTHYVGIGTTSPEAKLTIYDGASNHTNYSTLSGGVWQLADTFAYGTYNGLTCNRANGTKASPSAIQSGEPIGEYAFYGHDGNGYTGGAAIRPTASQTYSTYAHGTKIEFYTTPDNSGNMWWQSGVAMTLDGNKDLTVVGDVKAATFHVGADAGIDATVPVAPVAPAAVAGSMTFKKGILTAYTAPS